MRFKHLISRHSLDSNMYGVTAGPKLFALYKLKI